MDQLSGIEVVAERDSAAYGFTVRVHANGRLHRIIPMRDPQQPRFWCVVIFRCSPAGIPDEADRVWIGPRDLQRDELKATLGAIRADPAAWLAEPAHHALRTWMLDPQATAPLPPPSVKRGSREITTG
jgi:hypothetical protein